MEIRDLRRQNLELLCQIGFVRREGAREGAIQNPVYNQNGANEAVIPVVVCVGLYPNIARAVKGRGVQGRFDGALRPTTRRDMKKWREESTSRMSQISILRRNRLIYVV